MRSVILIALALGTPAGSAAVSSCALDPYSQAWCAACEELLGPFDPTGRLEACTPIDLVSTLAHNAMDPEPFLQAKWFVTHGTLDWDVHMQPAYTMDLATSSMIYTAGIFDQPSQDCCKYAVGDARGVCAEKSNGTYAHYEPYSETFPMLNNYVLRFPNGTADAALESTIDFGEGELVTMTFLQQATRDTALVHLCVLGGGGIPAVWNPFFQILSLDWDVDARVVRQYEAEIRERIDPDLRFFRNADPQQ